MPAAHNPSRLGLVDSNSAICPPQILLPLMLAVSPCLRRCACECVLHVNVAALQDGDLAGGPHLVPFHEGVY